MINRLSITQLRNLESVNISLSPTVNIFYGDNGSGKTSILEAISLLGLGRSFRSHKTRSLINHNEKLMTVFAEIMTNNQLIPVGIQKQRDGASHIRVSGENIYSAAVLARQLPLQVINADSFLLVEGSPNQRRQFLDWLVFHVKPEFPPLWKGLQKILKQRNSLLRRDKITHLDFRPWDTELCRLSEAIDSLRQEVFALFKDTFVGLYKELSSPDMLFDMSYHSGWNADQSFEQVLREDFERDCRDGYTHHGPQRADIKLWVNKKPAVDVLSRGQEKALVCAMHIAQARLYQQQRAQNCIFLVDDLLAELDKTHSQYLTRCLAELNGQVFITGVSEKELLDIWQDQSTGIAKFHVKHGSIEEIKQIVTV